MELAIGLWLLAGLVFGIYKALEHAVEQAKKENEARKQQTDTSE